AIAVDGLDRHLCARSRERSPASARTLGNLGQGVKWPYHLTSGPSARFAGLRAREKQLSLAGILRQRSRAFEVLASVIRASELREKITPDAREQVVSAQRGFVGERIDELEPCGRPERHRHRDRAV